MRKNILIMLVFSFFLSVVGFFALYAKTTKIDEAERIIKLDSSIQTETTFDFQLENFYPGKTEKFDVLIISKKIGKLEIEISFVEKDLGDLKNFIDVKIYYASGIIEKKLSDLLNGESIMLNGSDDTIVFEYYMNSDVGNEAQGAQSNFNITINISK